MTRRIGPFILFALLLAACNGSSEEAETPTTSPDATATTDAPTTTVDPTTTSLPPTTTTTGSNGTDAGSLLASLNASTDMTSARIEGSMQVSGFDEALTGLSDGSLQFWASFDAETGDSSFLMDMSSFMGAMHPGDGDPIGDLGEFADMFAEMEFREIGDTSYVRFPLLTMMFGAETDWVSMPAHEGEEWSSDLETVPTDPNELLEAFGEQGATVEEIGRESVNGVESTHYRAHLDAETMDFTPEEEADLVESGIIPSGEVVMDIWVSDDGYMVRMIMEIDARDAELPAGEQFDTMTLQYDMFDINEPVVIEPPPASQVTSFEDLESMFDFAP